MHNISIKETMEDNGCIFTPIQQTLAPQLLQVLEEMSSCTLKNFLVNLSFAGLNFRGEPLSKDFMGIKTGENLNL